MSLAKLFSKYWVFTLNNPTEDDLPPNVWPDIQFVIWQHEKGDEGTEHLQGYVAFTCRKRLAWLKLNCCARSHWDRRRGSHAEAKHYCMKPVDGCECEHCTDAAGQRLGGPWTHGDDAGISEGSGARTDLAPIDACKIMIDEGRSDADIAEEHFGTWSRHYRAFERYRKISKGAAKRTWITTVKVLWGAPGIGKSRQARFEAGENAYWLPKPEGSAVYWDGYDGQEHVVIDEFYGWIARTQMQRLCDSTPVLVSNKFGSTPFLAKKIWITSNEPPSQWWKNVGLGAMERRLTGEHGSVVHCTVPWTEPQEIIHGPAPAPVMAAQNLPDEFDPAAFWALFGTPDNGPNEVDPSDGPLEQPPLSRCPGCKARVYNHEVCSDCVERNLQYDVSLDRWYFPNEATWAHNDF